MLDILYIAALGFHVMIPLEHLTLQNGSPVVVAKLLWGCIQAKLISEN